MGPPRAKRVRGSGGQSPPDEKRRGGDAARAERGTGAVAPGSRGAVAGASAAGALDGGPRHRPEQRLPSGQYAETPRLPRQSQRTEALCARAGRLAAVAWIRLEPDADQHLPRAGQGARRRDRERPRTSPSAKDAKSSSSITMPPATRASSCPGRPASWCRCIARRTARPCSPTSDSRS